jgi:hypothetical protein
MSSSLVSFFVIVLGAARFAIAAPTPPATTVEVVAAPPIAAVPDGGVDPDVAARLRAVDAVVATTSPAQLDGLLDRVLVLYESDDPFSRAQRDAARPQTLALLTRIGERARAAGELVIAARAFDARWTIDGGHRDVQLGEVLSAWAERDAASAPAQALYLARRARGADPAQPRAARLDDDLSRNHRVWSGRLAIVAGIVALAAGIYMRSQVSAIEDDLAAHPRSGADVDRLLAERDRDDVIGTGLLVAAPVLSIGGAFWVLSGQPSYTPTSPAELPALAGR